jgi:hypothetical protein
MLAPRARRRERLHNGYNRLARVLEHARFAGGVKHFTVLPRSNA